MVASLNKEMPKGSKLHDEIRDKIRERYQMSYNEMVKRWPTWRKIIRERFAFPDAAAVAIKNRSRPDNDLEVQVPFTWAMQQTSVMYLTSVFLGRNPIFQYTGRHGEGQDQVLGMEALIDYQVQVGEMVPNMYTWISDSLDLGLGVIGEYWCEETHRVKRIVDKPAKSFLGMEIPGKTERVTETAEVPGYVGNKTFNVRSFDFFPDPRIPIRDCQRGEFCGRLTELGFHEIQEREANGEYFNVEELKKHLKRNSNQKSGFNRERTVVDEEHDIPEVTLNTSLAGRSDRNTDYVEILEMYVKVIPKDWGLGDSKYPEMWVFTLANDVLLIGARPYGMFHNRFPFHVLEYEINGHHVHARGMNEIIKPLNNVLTWMFNSHIYNVRKTINNELVVDPSRINMADFKRPGPGRILRLKAQAYGTDPKLSIHQLNMNDVTRGHLNDMNNVKNFMQMIFGLNDSLMGALGGSGRKTATEVRTSSTFGVNRLKTTAEYFSVTGFQSLSRNLVTSTQQLYDMERQFKIAGNSLNEKNFVRITPELISGFFDFVPVDGTLPVDRMLQANLFKELLMGAGKLSPQFLATYDIGKIFEHILQLNGIKNIESFKIQVVPDGQQPGLPAPQGAAPQGGSKMGANPGETVVPLNSPQNPGVNQ